MRSLIARGPRARPDGACADNFANAVGFENVQQCVELLLGAGCLDDKGLGGNVNHGCAEQVGCLNDLQADYGVLP